MSGLNTIFDNFVSEIVNPAILLLSAIALVVFAWGIFEFVFNQAADDKAREEGRRAILWGVVGFVIIFGAYGIINLALSTFNVSVTTPSGAPAYKVQDIIKSQ
ncbi:hypothetical protein KGO04_04500 [Patescibacteria group bacterium]|nr:hypothetical protein [Patescibacteria group bacterium]MDE1943936.1 hypothetical protein [Patescibacteria group bacterium]MDE1945483.1 hypothetical protein [Patescibacteria group bacterium]